jgi:hypothetical protein
LGSVPIREGIDYRLPDPGGPDLGQGADLLVERVLVARPQPAEGRARAPT